MAGRVAAGSTPEKVAATGRALRPLLAEVKSWDATALEAAIKPYADAQAGGQLGKVAQPLRVAVSGGTVSPPIFDTLAILGRDSSLARIDRAVRTFG